MPKRRAHLRQLSYAALLFGSQAACGATKPAPTETYQALSPLQVTKDGATTLLPSGVLASRTSGDDSLRLVFSNEPDHLSRDIQAPAAKKSTFYLWLQVAIGSQGGAGDGGRPTSPGTYQNLGGKLIFTSSDATNCTATGTETELAATSEVQLIAISTDDTPTTGVLHLTFKDGSTATGGFSMVSSAITQPASDATTSCY